MASGFWVGQFVNAGHREEPRELGNGIDKKNGVIGPGDVHWVLRMKLERDRPSLPGRFPSPRRPLSMQYSSSSVLSMPTPHPVRLF